MKDYIKKEKIAENRGDDGNRNNIKNLIPSSLYFIKCADALGTTEVEYKSDRNSKKTCKAKIPLEITIQSVGKRRSKTNCSDAKKYEDDRRKTAQRSNDDRNGAQFKNFFEAKHSLFCLRKISYVAEVDTNEKYKSSYYWHELLCNFPVCCLVDNSGYYEKDYSLYESTPSENTHESFGE